MDRWSDGQGENSVPPFNFVEGGGGGYTPPPTHPLITKSGYHVYEQLIIEAVEVFIMNRIYT